MSAKLTTAEAHAPGDHHDSQVYETNNMAKNWSTIDQY